MKLSTVSSLVLSILPLASAVPTPQTDATAGSNLAAAQDQFELFAEQALNATLERLDAEEASLKKRGLTATCTSKNLSIRREFGSLSKAERKAYTDAVLCLQAKTTKTPSTVASGARSRFDDFIVTHIQQTGTIHYTGTFLGWHRWFIFVYEEALKNECGFKGTIPYWEWSKYASAPQNSPLFNGDAYSMSGNGEFIPGHTGPILAPPIPGLGEDIQLDAGLGGGCVTTGPFKNYTVNLGPVAHPTIPTGPEGGLGYNPRCLKRDIGPGVALKYTNWTAVLTTIAKTDIDDFQLTLQGKPGSGNIGPHGGGHYTIGGDPGGDVYTSPGDPAFYLHHGQIDRVWSIWQALDLPNRQNAIAGTNTFLNYPPSANTTLADTFNLGYADSRVVVLKDVMSTTSGPFCYVYL